MSRLTSRGHETRARIVEAAAELIHRQGVAATSVDQVLERSGAGKGQFYHYFGAKEDLVQAVLAYQMERDWISFGPFLERLDSWDGIREWFGAVVRQQELTHFAGGCPVGAMAGEVAGTSEPLRADLTAAFQEKRRWLREGLGRMAERGDLTAGADPEALSEFVLATLQGALLVARTRRSRAPLEQALEHAFRHLASYGSPPPEEPTCRLPGFRG